jgi:hypothetical protein
VGECVSTLAGESGESRMLFYDARFIDAPRRTCLAAGDRWLAE